jgi:hypothetical protein
MRQQRQCPGRLGAVLLEQTERVSHGDPDKIRGTYNKTIYLKAAPQADAAVGRPRGSLKRGNVVAMPSRAAQV